MTLKQRVGVTNLTSDTPINSETADSEYYEFTVPATSDGIGGNTTTQMCDRLTIRNPDNNPYRSAWAFTLNSKGGVRVGGMDGDEVAFPTENDLKTFLGADGITVLYPLLTPQTIVLPNISLPELPAAGATVWASAPVPAQSCVEWWTEEGKKVADAQQSADNAQNTANDAVSDAGENAAAIQAAQSSIELLQRSISQMVTDENGTSLMTQTSDGWTFNIGGLQSDVEAAATGINEVKGDLSQIDSLVQQTKDLADDIAEKTAYMTLTQDSNGDPALELGNTASDFKIRITNTSIDFMEGTSRIAYLTNKQLYIQSSVVTDEMKIGATSGFVWKKRANGNMGLRWVSS